MFSLPDSIDFRDTRMTISTVTLGIVAEGIAIRKLADHQFPPLVYRNRDSTPTDQTQHIHLLRQSKEPRGRNLFFFSKHSSANLNHAVLRWELGKTVTRNHIHLCNVCFFRTLVLTCFSLFFSYTSEAQSVEADPPTRLYSNRFVCSLGSALLGGN